MLEMIWHVRDVRLEDPEDNVFQSSKKNEQRQPTKIKNETFYFLKLFNVLTLRPSKM